MPKLTWQKIENALINICIAYDLEVIRSNDSGDALADTTDWLELNLTEIAKDLEKEL